VPKLTLQSVILKATITTISSRIKEVGADIIIFPELCITGYPPEDLLLNPAFINKNLSYLEKIKNYLF